MLKYIGYLFLLPVFYPCSILFKKKKQAHIEAFSYAGAVCQQGNTELSFLVLLL